jgi:tetratricopeptide (TPR) repeat protein
MEEISLQEYRKQIEDMVDQGRYSEAVAHGKWILQQFPRYVEAYRLLGKAMLEARQNEHAADMFLRVLSADPEDMLSWVAMSEIADRTGDLDGAVWYLERAFELATDNDLLGEELRQLYGRRDGAEPERVELTRGALARLYLKGDLLSRAIGELRALVAAHPERVDFGVALAEALWRDDQRLEASEVCQQVLGRMPYCLKANLLLGEIWVNSGREEGNIHLRRAEALDPENKSARELLGEASPLAVREVGIAPLEHKASGAGERPAWMSEVEAASTGGPPLTDSEATLVDIAAGLEAQIEIPSWLEEIDVAEGEAGPELPGLDIPLGGPMTGQPGSEQVEEAPAWLAGVVGDTEQPGEAALPAAAAPGGQVAWEEEGEVSEDIPEWLAGLGLGGESTNGEQSPEAAEEDDLPGFLSGLSAESGAQGVSPAVESTGEADSDWLSELQGQLPEAEGGPEGAAPAPADVPDWMQALAPESGTPEAAEPAASGVGEVFAMDMPAETPAEEPGEPVPADVPEWLQGLAPAEAAAPAAAAESPLVSLEEPAPPGGEAETPDWLEGEQMPSGEEALAWLEQLAAGKEEELQAQVEAEIEARTAEIMGRPKPAEPEAARMEDVVGPVAGVAPAEGLAPAEIPDWMQDLAPTGGGAPAVAGPGYAETAPPLGEPIAETADVAFGWTEFGGEGFLAEADLPPAENLQPPAEPAPLPSDALGRSVAEQVAPPEEIEAPPFAEAAGEAQPAPEEVVAASIGEAFGWTEFGEVEQAAVEAEQAPPEAGVPVAAADIALAPESVPPREEVEAPPAVGWPAAEQAPSVEAMAVEGLLEEPGIPSEPVALPPVAETVTASVAPAPPPQPPGPRPAPKPLGRSVAAPFAAERAYLKEHPRDYDAWLSLARGLWQTGDRSAALTAYGRLIRAGKSLDTVTTELEEYVEQWPDVATRRVLGDAYMKSGMLDRALALYREALDTL